MLYSEDIKIHLTCVTRIAAHVQQTFYVALELISSEQGISVGSFKCYCVTSPYAL